MSDVIIRTEALVKHFDDVEALKGHRHRGRDRHRVRPARAQRRGQDDRDPDPDDPAHAHQRPGGGRRAGFRARRRGAAVPDRSRGTERGGRREPDRAREPRARRTAVPPLEGGGAPSFRGCPGAVPTDGCRGTSGEDVLRRHAPTAGPGREPGRAPRRLVPRRADDGPRPAEPARRVGLHPGAEGRRHHADAHDAVPRGGRSARGPDRRDRRRIRDRPGNLRRAEGSDRWRGRGAARQGPRGPRSRGRSARRRGSRYARCRRGRRACPDPGRERWAGRAVGDGPPAGRHGDRARGHRPASPVAGRRLPVADRARGGAAPTTRRAAANGKKRGRKSKRAKEASDV